MVPEINDHCLQLRSDGCFKDLLLTILLLYFMNYEGWNFNSGNYLFTTDTK